MDYPKIVYVKIYPVSTDQSKRLEANDELKRVGIENEEIGVYQLIHVKKKLVIYDLGDINRGL